MSSCPRAATGRSKQGLWGFLSSKRPGTISREIGQADQSQMEVAGGFENGGRVNTRPGLGDVHVTQIPCVVQGEGAGRGSRALKILRFLAVSPWASDKPWGSHSLVCQR